MPGAENELANTDGDRAGVGGNTAVQPIERHVGSDAARGVAVTPIPASIVRAISKIKSTVEALKKSQRNQHGGYMFSSTDDLYAALARKMGDVELICMALEEKCEIKRIELTTKDGPKTSQWANIEYSFVWATPDDTWTDLKAKRSIYIQVTGPQTFQAAQSFIEKAYLRSTFKLPSGDMDLDSMPQAETEEDQNDILAPRKRKSSAQAKRDGDPAAFNELRGAISGADGPADLEMIIGNHWAFIQSLPTRWRQIVDAEIEDRRAEWDDSNQAAE